MNDEMSNYIERYWRDATPADAIKEPPMVARFRDEDDKEWLIGKLFGFDRSRKYKWCGETRDAIKCQVYDAPDPGEGWRLVDVEKETPKEGDQYLVHPSQWVDRGDCHGCFKDDKFYRRRIKPPKPKYVPFEWQDREQLKSRWIQYSSKGQTVVEVCVKFTNDEDGFLINDTYNYWLLDNATFLDTGEPVGRKVQ